MATSEKRHPPPLLLTWAHRAYRHAWRFRGARRVLTTLTARVPAPDAIAMRTWGGGNLLFPRGARGGYNAYWSTGCYEEMTSAVILRLAPDRDFYDIGANVGYFTVLALAHGARSVTSFEPFPPNIEWLRENVAANDGAARGRILTLALGAEPAVLPLHSGGDFGDGSVSLTSATSAEVVAEVEVDRLDTIRGREQLPLPGLIKMDIEGFEDAALAGMEETLRASTPTIVVELNQAALEAAGSSPKTVCARMAALGYLKPLSLNARVIRPYQDTRFANALFVHPTDAARVATALAPLLSGAARAILGSSR